LNELLGAAELRDGTIAMHELASMSAHCHQVQHADARAEQVLAGMIMRQMHGAMLLHKRSASAAWRLGDMPA
jgi:hypothetical protein